jgi:membrane protein
VPRSRTYSRWTLTGRVAERAARAYLEDGCPQVAASIAYRVIFALFPLAIVMTALSGIVLRTTGSDDEVVDAIVRNLPLSEEGRDDLRALLLRATGALGGVGLLGLVPLVWAATGLMGAIRYALNRAWDVSQRRPYLQGKAFDLLFVLVAFVLVAMSLGLSVGTSIVERHASGLVESIGGDPAAVTWLLGRVAPFLLTLIAVVSAYRLLPATTPSLRDVWPSAVGVAVVLALLQSLFGVYIAYVRDFDVIYGSLGAVIAFLYFIYLSANLFLLGAEAAAELPRARRELESHPARAGHETDKPVRLQLWSAVRSLVVRDDAAAPQAAASRRKRP